MSNSNYDFEDQGTVGEKKTRQGRQTYIGPLDATYTRYTGNTRFVTPKVDGDIAEFKWRNFYSFQFSCINWKYWINYDWQRKRMPLTIYFPIKLVSPDGKTEIETKELNLAASSELNMPPTQEQLDIIAFKAAHDLLTGEERILAAQQAVKWVIDNDLDVYSLAEKTKPLEFDLERVGNKEFIKSEINISNGTENKKCSIWAINDGSYRNEISGERIITVWVAKIISESDNFIKTINQARMIFETLKFDGIFVYPDFGKSR